MAFVGSNKVFLLTLFFMATCFTAQLSHEHKAAISLAPQHPPALSPAEPPTHHHHHHHHHHPHPPLKPPVHPPLNPPAHPPVHPPVKPPAHPPVKPPSYPFPRRFVAVRGVVYCKSCNYSGVDTLLGASPLPGATVKLECNNTKYPTVAKEKTDKNGYFLLKAPKTITTYGVNKCRAFLELAPNTACSKKTDLHGGLTGAKLTDQKPVELTGEQFVVFTVGPFAFESKCHR